MRPRIRPLREIVQSALGDINLAVQVDVHGFHVRRKQSPSLGINLVLDELLVACDTRVAKNGVDDIELLGCEFEERENAVPVCDVGFLERETAARI
jgi:hypothetical protein